MTPKPWPKGWGFFCLKLEMKNGTLRYAQGAILNGLGILYTPGIRPTQPRSFGRGFFVSRCRLCCSA